MYKVRPGSSLSMDRMSFQSGSKEGWTVYSSSVNLPAALNDPGKGTTFHRSVSENFFYDKYLLRINKRFIHEWKKKKKKSISFIIKRILFDCISLLDNWHRTWKIFFQTLIMHAMHVYLAPSLFFTLCSFKKNDMKDSSSQLKSNFSSNHYVGNGGNL